MFEHDKPVIFFESFGNKRLTIERYSSIDSIKQKICSTFSESAREFIGVDLCNSVSYGNGTVTLANDNLFKALDLVPNFKPLLTDTVKNCHLSVPLNFSHINTTRIGKFEKCFKVNFYSTYKYYFDFDSTDNYVLSLANRLLFSTYEGLELYNLKDSFEDLTRKYKNIENLTRENASNGACMLSYRLQAYLNILNKYP